MKCVIVLLFEASNYLYYTETSRFLFTYVEAHRQRSFSLRYYIAMSYGLDPARVIRLRHVHRSSVWMDQLHDL